VCLNVQVVFSLLYVLSASETVLIWVQEEQKRAQAVIQEIEAKEASKNKVWIFVQFKFYYDLWHTALLLVL
jgi:ABC-type nickel/cobalt efflux system permease component RcnA